jgi:hypothetical protein
VAEAARAVAATQAPGDVAGARIIANHRRPRLIFVLHRRAVRPDGCMTTVLRCGRSLSSRGVTSSA